MMGRQDSQHELFSYRINLEHRVRADHPLRKVAAAVDFTFAREEVARFYGRNGHESVDPAVLLKMMFLLFFDDIASERELMKIIAERLDYLWFLGYHIDDLIPDHSVLSKARARWGGEVFESLFVRTVAQCVEAGLVDGSKIHLDATLVDAEASNNSVRRSSPELIAALKKAYGAQAAKLEEKAAASPAAGEKINATLRSTTDPDAAVVRARGGGPRARYKHHRAIDDAHGVITAVETTAGDVDEGARLASLCAQHQSNTDEAAATVVADSKYGTIDNYIDCQQVGITTHMADLAARQRDSGRRAGIFGEEKFSYQPQSDTFLCPAGETMKARRLHPVRQTWEYVTAGGVCARCPLRSQCTRSRTGRTIHRHREHEWLQRGRAQAASAAARRDRRRRKHLMEGSFADGANNHGLKRARWRRLWRQRIQDQLIAACQNIRLLLARGGRRPKAVPAVAANHVGIAWVTLCSSSFHATRRVRAQSHATLPPRRSEANFIPERPIAPLQ